jgi:PRC-barrel domain
MMTFAQALLVGVLMGLMSHLWVDTAAAQTSPPSSAPMARPFESESGVSPQLIKPPIQVRNVRSVLGIEVRSADERNIGRIVDLLADVHGGVGAAVIEFGGFLGIGTRKIAIDWSALRFETEEKQLFAILDIPRDQLRDAADFKPDRPSILGK